MWWLKSGIEAVLVQVGTLIKCRKAWLSAQTVLPVRTCCARAKGVLDRARIEYLTSWFKIAVGIRQCWEC